METPKAVAETLEALLLEYGSERLCPAYMLCDRHPTSARALTLIDEEGETCEITYGELQMRSRQVAAGLSDLGISPGDRVGTLMTKSVEHLVALLAIYRLGAVQVPLFTAFAPGAIGMRLEASRASLVICSEDQQHKLQPGPDLPERPSWRTVVVGRPDIPGASAFEDLSGDAQFQSDHVGADSPMILIFTSGTTGDPKSVVVPASALAAFHAYMVFGLDLRDDDVYWNAADPGWAYGLYFGVLGPMLLGRANIWLRGGFSAPRTWDALVNHHVTNFAAAPTIYRTLKGVNSLEQPAGLSLRCASAAGEPLTPDVNEWAVRVLGVPVHDHYGQTEAGMIVNNHHAPQLHGAIKPGSMGRSMPGWTVEVLDLDDDAVVPVETLGRIAVRLEASPLAWFEGYLEEDAEDRFTSDRTWYLTGDTGRCDEDGDIYFVSRDDDVILMAGYRIGPVDVESVLMMHPDVLEAAVVGVPDAIRGEVLEAYVVPRDGAAAGAGLTAELQQLVKDRYAAHAYPRRVHFVQTLPRTPSGKVQRFELRREAARAGAAHHSE